MSSTRQTDESEMRWLTNEFIQTKTQALWDNKIFLRYSGSGSNVGFRLPKLLPLGSELFRNED